MERVYSPWHVETSNESKSYINVGKSPLKENSYTFKGCNSYRTNCVLLLKGVYCKILKGKHLYSGCTNIGMQRSGSHLFMVNYLFECSCPIITGLHLDNDNVLYIQIITGRKWTLCKLYYEYISCLYFIFCCKRYGARISAKTKGETSLLFFYVFFIFVAWRKYRNRHVWRFSILSSCNKHKKLVSFTNTYMRVCNIIFDDSEMHLSKRDHQVGHIEITWNGQRTENTHYHIYWTFPEDCLIM